MVSIGPLDRNNPGGLYLTVNDAKLTFSVLEEFANTTSTMSNQQIHTSWGPPIKNRSHIYVHTPHICKWRTRQAWIISRCYHMALPLKLYPLWGAVRVRNYVWLLHCAFGASALLASYSKCHSEYNLFSFLIQHKNNGTVARWQKQKETTAWPKRGNGIGIVYHSPMTESKS